jgi:hypothetical protein
LLLSLIFTVMLFSRLTTIDRSGASGAERT